MAMIYKFIFLLLGWQKSAGGDAGIAPVDISPYIFTTAFSLFPAVLYYALPLQPMFLLPSV